MSRIVGSPATGLRTCVLAQRFTITDLLKPIHMKNCRGKPEIKLSPNQILGRQEWFSLDVLL